MIRKILAIFCLAAMCLTFPGCGDSGGSEGGQVNPDRPKRQPPGPAGGGASPSPQGEGGEDDEE